MKTRTIVFLLVIICPTIMAQTKARIRLFYQEPQISRLNNNLDSIKIYVKEPFQQTRTFSRPDLGYETNFDFIIEEYCPIQVCKNNQCIDLFIDSEEIQILGNPEQFRESKSINSPSSVEWQSILQEGEQLLETQFDSLDIVLKQQQGGFKLAEFYNYFNDQFKQVARRWISINIDNPVGWNLLLRYPELFDPNEINSLSNAFDAALSCRSTKIVKTRIASYSNLRDQTKSIYSVFDHE